MCVCMHPVVDILKNILTYFNRLRTPWTNKGNIFDGNGIDSFMLMYANESADVKVITCQSRGQWGLLPI